MFLQKNRNLEKKIFVIDIVKMKKKYFESNCRNEAKKSKKYL